MNETDLSEGFGFKPGSLSKIMNVENSYHLLSNEECQIFPSIACAENFCVLEDDFQTLNKVLKSKYDAINIFKKISHTMNVERMSLENHLLEITLVFKNEIIKLQDELEKSKAVFYENLRIWTARFKDLDAECSMLKEVLMSKSKSIQKLTSDNIELLQENQQLIFLLSKYENFEKKTNNNYGISTDPDLLQNSAEDYQRGKLFKNEMFRKYNSFDTYPCFIKSSNPHVKCKCEKYQTEAKLDETYVMVEAYKVAFEELLAKNRELTLKFAKYDEFSKLKNTH